MYIPDIYKQENRDEIESFLSHNSFGILVSQSDSQLWASHIPMQLAVNSEGKQVLHGHISKENPQWENFEEAEVLAIFSGPHSYISSSWYDHENVPTWNYTAVHVYGKAKIIEGEAVNEILRKLVDTYEQESENPVRVDQLSKETMRQVRGIVAFEIEISLIEAVQKMSQNRDSKNYQNIISELEKKGDSDALKVAAEMKKCLR